MVNCFRQTENKSEKTYNNLPNSAFWGWISMERKLASKFWFQEQPLVNLHACIWNKKSWAWKHVFIEFLSGFLLRMKQEIVTGWHLYSRNLYYKDG